MEIEEKSSGKQISVLSLRPPRRVLLPIELASPLPPELAPQLVSFSGRACVSSQKGMLAMLVPPIQLERQIEIYSVACFAEFHTILHCHAAAHSAAHCSAYVTMSLCV